MRRLRPPSPSTILFVAVLLGVVVPPVVYTIAKALALASVSATVTPFVAGVERLYACTGDNVTFAVRYRVERPVEFRVVCDIPWAEDRPLAAARVEPGSGVLRLSVTAVSTCRTLYVEAEVLDLGVELELGPRVVVGGCR